MADSVRTEYVSASLNALSNLESNKAVLYTALADRMKFDKAKTMLLDAAEDCRRNSALLKNTGVQLSSKKVKPYVGRQINNFFGTTYSIFKDVIDKDEIADLDLQNLLSELSALEKSLMEKYVFVHSRTMRLIYKTYGMQNFNLYNVKSILAKIISDSENHRKTLETIQELMEPKMHEEEASFVPAAAFMVVPEK